MEEPDLMDAEAHILSCWKDRLRSGDPIHQNLETVWPDEDELVLLAHSLQETLSLELIHSLPCDVIRLFVAGMRINTSPNAVVKSLLVHPFLPEADQVIESIMSGTQVPNNVVLFKKPRMH